MASVRQILASQRLNANQSDSRPPITGSCRAILKDEVAGRIKIIRPEETYQVACERQEQWRPLYQPSTPLEENYFAHLCLHSVLVDQASHRVMAQQDELAQRAKETWDDDRHYEVLLIAEGLSKRPEVVAVELQQRLHGCDWLIDQWEEIQIRVTEDRAWTSQLWARALDLLGIAHADRHRATTDLLGEGHTFEASLRLIDAQLKNLKRRIERDLEARDEQLRNQTIQGMPVAPSPGLKQAQSDHREALQRFHRYAEQLLELLQREREVRNPEAPPPPKDPARGPKAGPTETSTSQPEPPVA